VTTTAPWADVSLVSASEVNSGKPTDAERDDGQPPPLAAGRPRRAGDAQVDHGEQRRAGGPGERHEPRVQLLHGDPGGGQRHAEREDAQRAEDEAGRAVRRYPDRDSNATLCLHGER
jgi:hypothetical protein